MLTISSPFLPKPFIDVDYLSWLVLLIPIGSVFVCRVTGGNRQGETAPGVDGRFDSTKTQDPLSPCCGVIQLGMFGWLIRLFRVQSAVD